MRETVKNGREYGRIQLTGVQQRGAVEYNTGCGDVLYGKCGICTGRKDAVTRAVPVDEDDRSDVRANLETMVGKGDTVELLAVSRWKSAAVVQEIQRVEDLAQPESVRRLQLDLDEGGGREGLARLRRDVDAGVVPTPAVIRQSSRERYQVLRSSSSATRRSRR